MTAHISFIACSVLYWLAIVYLLVATARDLFKYIILYKNIRKSVFVLYGVLILLILWFVIAQGINLFNNFRNSPPLNLESLEDIISVAPFVGVLFSVLILYGLVHFPIMLFEYFKYRKTEGERTKRFAFVNVILMTVFTLVVFWFVIQPFAVMFYDIGKGGGLPSPTLLYISLSDFLCKYWFVGFIPVIGLILFETKIKLNKELKLLIYQFIAYGYGINISLIVISLYMPFATL